MCWDISATSLSVSELVAPGVIAGNTEGGDGPRGGGGRFSFMSLTILRLMVIVSLFIDEQISQKYHGIIMKKSSRMKLLLRWPEKVFEIVPPCELLRVLSPNSLN